MSITWPRPDRRWARLPALGLLVAAASFLARAQTAEVAGLREPAWSPDGRKIAASVLDQIWTMAPDGRQARPLVLDRSASGVEREPAWSRDGQTVAFSADRGDGFDIYAAPARGGPARQVIARPGDERWPSWTPDGRLVFAHKEPGAFARWDLFITSPRADSSALPTKLTDSPDNDTQPAVSPDGSRVAFVSDRGSNDGDVDLWVMAVPRESAGAQQREGEPGRDRRAGRPVRIAPARGPEAFPSWAPDGERIAYYAVREGLGSVWVASVDPLPAPAGENDGEDAGEQGEVRRLRPAATPVLVSRRGGTPAWSPDGRTILIAQLPDAEPFYNGNPLRDQADPPPLFAGGRAFTLWSVPAPAPADAGARAVSPDSTLAAGQLVAAFDRVWTTLRRLYYAEPPGSSEWEALRLRHRPQAEAARDEAALEAVVDRLIAEQPLIKPVVTSTGVVVVSGHPLASEAGAAALRKGGNIVDAAIAVSFALGVVEPEASGIGGDGMAVLYLKGMAEPAVVDYKDQTPIRATADNPKIVREGRLIADGPAAANIPGVVAGLDYMHRHYGSGKVAWADLVAPAIELAEQGFVLDAALPTSLAEGRRMLERYPEARRIYLPDDRVPQPGDRFVNRDYGATLRAIAKDGADVFYRGEIAKKIAADMAASGGIIGVDDLAQYRAIERRPLRGRYRGHLVFAAPPPVSLGASLIETLQILEHYTPRGRASYTADADYLHYLIEAWKVRDAIRRAADPAHWAVEVDSHLDPAHAAELFKRISPTAASRYPRGSDEDLLRTGPPERIGRGTTAFVVADVEGNMMAVTQTLSTWGGSFYVSKGLGFLYNNHLRSNRTTAGTYGQLLPLTRSSTASVPTLVFREQGGVMTSRLAVGAAGNAWIGASVYNIITNVIDAGLPMQRAVEAPRFLIGRDPADPLGTAARTQVEDRIPRLVLDDLVRRGHVFQKIGRKGEVRYGYASAVLVDVARGLVEGGADPRRSHAAVAVDRAEPTRSADFRHYGGIRAAMHPGWLRCASLTYGPIFSVVAPCQPGASLPSVRHRNDERQH